MNISIIGGGTSGIITAIAVAKKIKNKRIFITIYESCFEFGGRAFNTGSENMLLNTSVGVTFIEPNNKFGFLEYLNQQRELNVTPEDIVTRDAFFEYLKTELHLANEHVGYIKINKKSVTGIELDKQNLPYIIVDQESIAYDVVVLATGLGFKKAPTLFSTETLISPYPAQALSNLNRTDPILILGSRLSAVDALTHLVGCRHRGQIDIYSPSQMFPAVRRHVVIPAQRDFLQSYLSKQPSLPNDRTRIDYLMTLFEQHLQQHGVKLSDVKPTEGQRGYELLEYEIRLSEEKRNGWEDILMDIIDILNVIWFKLPSVDKVYFKQEINPWLGRIIQSMPLCNAKIVQTLFNRGQARLISGSELAEVNLNAYQAIINATGLQSVEDDPLLSSLANQQLINFNGQGGVAINIDTYRVRTDLPIYANGPIVQGAIFTANSIYSSSYGAEKIANDINKLFTA